MSDTAPILIEHGPTPDGGCLVKVDGVLLGKPHKAAGVAKTAADAEAARLRTLPENRGTEIRVTRRYFQVTTSKGGDLPGRQPKPLDELTTAEVSGLTLAKLEEALATGAHDEALADLAALERVKPKPRGGAFDALNERAEELQDAADAVAAREQHEADTAQAEADAAARAVEFATELGILAIDEADLIAAITAGDYDDDDMLTKLAMVEAGEPTPRQAVLDAISDRIVAAAAEFEDAEAERLAEEAAKAAAEAAEADRLAELAAGDNEEGEASAEAASEEAALANDGASEADGDTANADAGDGATS